jgi:hypothetical protein
MPKRFRFADAFWFRVPIKVLVLTVTVFALVSIWPAFSNGSVNDHERAFLGVTVVLMFMALGTTFAVAISDSYVELDAESLYIHFEAFFSAEVPVSDIIAVRHVDPRPRWRYRFGLSTDFEERIACSHGGPFVEIELAHAWKTRLWPRQIAVRRFWLAVRERDALVEELRRLAPRAFADGAPELRVAA